MSEPHSSPVPIPPSASTPAGDVVTATQALRVETVNAVARYALDLSPRQANDLYNEVYALLRDRGVMSARDREPGFMPTLCGIYDALYAAGVDGSA